MPTRFYAPTGRESWRSTCSPALGTLSQEAGAGSSQAGRHSHDRCPRGVSAPSTKVTEKAPPVEVAVTISAGDARTTEGRSQRKEALVFPLGPRTLTCRPLLRLLCSNCGSRSSRGDFPKFCPLKYASLSMCNGQIPASRELKGELNLFHSFQVCGTREVRTRNRESRDGS